MTALADTYVVMQESVLPRVSETPGRSSFMNLILSRAETQMDNWKPTATKIMQEFIEKEISRQGVWELPKVESARKNLCQQWFYTDCGHGTLIKRTIDLSKNCSSYRTCTRTFDCNCLFLLRKRTMHRIRVCGKAGGDLETEEKDLGIKGRNSSVRMSRKIQLQCRGSHSEQNNDL